MHKIRPWHLILLCSGLFFITGLFVVTRESIFFDEFIISIIQSVEHPIITRILTFFTHLGSYIGTIAVFILVSILFYFNRKGSEIILLSFVIATTPVLNLILKQIFHRPRPEIHRLIEIGGYSFPSGHTMYAVSLYGTTLYLLWNMGTKRAIKYMIALIHFVIIGLITISRVYLGVHYPTDILGGIFASVALIAVSAIIFSLFHNRKTL